MKTLYLGGVKSGKSKLAEAYLLQKTDNPIYLATTELLDEGMKERIKVHKASRSSRFTVVEEPKDIKKVLEQSTTPVLVECMTMWINNLLFYGYTKEVIIKEVEAIAKLDREVVFVLNEVGTGLIGSTKLERDFVDLSGVVGQILARECDEVYQVVVGLEKRLK